MTAPLPDWVVDGVNRLVEQHCPRESRADNLGWMEHGHAGLTYGFDVIDAAGERCGSYVLKLAPRGVVRRGNTDVYRQAPLLRALHGAGLPVPAVPWAASDELLFGTPFIVMERLPGRVFLTWEGDKAFAREPEAVRSVWRKTAEMLARFHRVDWRNVLRDWEAPQALADELARWAPVLRHAQEDEWLSAGTALGEGLAASLPEEQPIGLVHGDYQPGNILFDNGEASGVIDWELSSIGAQGLDVGWLLMMLDGSCWDPAWRLGAPLSRGEVIARYSAAGGPAIVHLDWYQALACYRMGAIACLNVKLHRSGRREDPLWEQFASSISRLFARGLALLEEQGAARLHRMSPT